MMSLEDSDSKFIPMSVLYVSSGNKAIEVSIAKVVQDFSSIPKDNWCGYVIECLCHANKVRKKSNEARDIFRIRVGGCLV